MIQLKSKTELNAMKEAGRITGEAILKASEHIKEGVTTKHIDDVIRDYIEKCGARPSFLGLYGFPASACISVNEEVIHGIPSADRVLVEGDIVKIDTGAFYRGYNGDSANTFCVGNVSEEAKRLIEATKQSFYCALEQVKQGARIGDIGAAVAGHVEPLGFSVVKQYVGHGVGRDLHEDPEVPNYGRPGHGIRLMSGMTIAIEPMVCAGSDKVRTLSNAWTVVTSDGKLAAHYEHTVAVTEDGAVLLTKV